LQSANENFNKRKSKLNWLVTFTMKLGFKLFAVFTKILVSHLSSVSNLYFHDITSCFLSLIWQQFIAFTYVPSLLSPLKFLTSFKAQLHIEFSAEKLQFCLEK
jgi:hypothetical protein